MQIKNKKIITISILFFLMLSMFAFYKFDSVKAATFSVSNIYYNVGYSWSGFASDLDNVNNFDINTSAIDMGSAGGNLTVRFEYNRLETSGCYFYVVYEKQWVGSTFLYSLTVYDQRWSYPTDRTEQQIVTDVTYDVTDYDCVLFFDNSTDTVNIGYGSAVISYNLNFEITENCVDEIHASVTDPGIIGTLSVSATAVESWSITSYNLDFSDSDFVHGDIFVDVYESDDLVLPRYEVTPEYPVMSVREGYMILIYGVPNSGYIFNATEKMIGGGTIEYMVETLSGAQFNVDADWEFRVSFVALPAGMPEFVDLTVNAPKGNAIDVNINGEVTQLLDVYSGYTWHRFSVPQNTIVYFEYVDLGDDYNFSLWTYTGTFQLFSGNLSQTYPSSDNPFYLLFGAYSGEEWGWFTWVDVSVSEVWVGTGTEPTLPPLTPTPTPTSSEEPYTPFTPLIDFDTALPIFGGIFLTILFAILFAVLAGRDGLLIGLILGILLSSLLGLFPIWIIIFAIILGGWMIVDKSGLTDRVSGGSG